MFNLTINLKQSGPGSKALLDGLKGLAGSHVYVGIPEKTSNRKGEPITNAELAFIHTHGVRNWKMRTAMDLAVKGSKKLSYSQALALYVHTFGSPAFQIPPRPIVEPAIEDTQNQQIIEKELELAAKAAVAGNKLEMARRLKRAGMIRRTLYAHGSRIPRTIGRRTHLRRSSAKVPAGH